MEDVRVGIEDLRRAAAAIAPHVLRTPLVHSEALSQAAARDVYLKLESHQHTGSFKPRGACYKLLSLPAEERARGIVAASAGNHALGVAYACRVLGVPNAELFVQRNAAPAKVAKLRRYPVRLHLVGDTFEDAQQAALAHAERTRAVFVSAYDDPAVVAGQGTCGLEIVEQLAAFEAVVVPVGSGALSAGIAIAVKALVPSARVIGVNPEASPSALLSFQQGRALDPYDHEPTLAHGLAGGYGKLPFALARGKLDAIRLVSEDELRRGIAALIDADQLLAEASGIAAVAAVLYGKIEGSGPVVAVVSGGNIDAATLKTIL